MATDLTIYRATDAAALAAHLLAAHDLPRHPGAGKELTFLLSDRIPFSHAQPLAAGSEDVARGAFRNFVYDKASRMLFLDCAPGRHRVLMACLECLYHCDPAARSVDWAQVLSVNDAAIDQLADAFVDNGHGFFLSSVWQHWPTQSLDGKKITLSQNFCWDAEEHATFLGYGRDYV